MPAETRYRHEREHKDRSMDKFTASTYGGSEEETRRRTEELSSGREERYKRMGESPSASEGTCGLITADDLPACGS